MAFTLITANVRILDSIEFPDPTPYFHPEDIAILLNQDGAAAVTPVAVKIGSDPACIAMIGVELPFRDKETGDITINRMDKENLHFIILPCPPYNNNGGYFELFPELREDRAIGKSSRRKAFDRGKRIE